MADSTPAESSIQFRAAKGEDREFLFRVYASTREAELAPVPWTPEQKHAFLRQQFAAQDHHYRTYFQGAEFLVIQIDGRDAGRLYLHRTERVLGVMDIALLPGDQKRGIGTRIMRDLIAAAEREQRSLSLHVEPTNPARRLYERLGFVFAEEAGVYIRMVRDCASVS